MSCEQEIADCCGVPAFSEAIIFVLAIPIFVVAIPITAINPENEISGVGIDSGAMLMSLPVAFVWSISWLSAWIISALHSGCGMAFSLDRVFSSCIFAGAAMAGVALTAACFFRMVISAS